MVQEETLIGFFLSEAISHDKSQPYCEAQEGLSHSLLFLSSLVPDFVLSLHIYGNWWPFKVYIHVPPKVFKKYDFFNQFEYFPIHLNTECTISQPSDRH